MNHRWWNNWVEEGGCHNLISAWHCAETFGVFHLPLVTGQWWVSDGVSCWTFWGHWGRGQVQIPVWWQSDTLKPRKVHRHTKQSRSVMIQIVWWHIHRFPEAKRQHFHVFCVLPGSDIMMQLDDVVSSTVTGPRVEEAMHRSIRWLDRCIAANKNQDKQNLFAIIQGGLNAELRKTCLDGKTLSSVMIFFKVRGRISAVYFRDCLWDVH